MAPAVILFSIRTLHVSLCLWNCATIRVAFYPIDAKATDAINRAIEELESKSCIRFVQRTSINRGMYPNYVSFEPLPG